MRILHLLWLFFIRFFMILFGIDVLVSGQCLNDQKNLLLKLNNSISFNSTLSVKLVQWNQSTDCCQWDGVECGAGGRVIGLDLSNESISGGIDDSSSLFNLQYLQRLNLAFNSFNRSQIPSVFSNLPNLRYLNLSNAGFAGQIPIEISNLRRLVTLDLSVPSSSILGVSLLKLENPNLAMFVENLKKLTGLYLDGVNISAQGNEWCQALSSSLRNLQNLSMSNCYLSGPVEPSLAHIQSLSIIRLDGNNLSAAVPKFFANFSNLTTLSLSSTGLYGTFPEEILKVPTLQTLDLSSNQLLEGFLPEFPRDASLHTLVLSDTTFQGELPVTIGNLGRLSRIELVGCNFSGSIPNTLANLTQLVYLDFSSNQFTGPVPSFSSSRNLTQLILAHNLLNGSINSTKWEVLSNLVNLALQNNSLSGEIPSSLFGIPSLQKIQLWQNQFTGQLNKLPNVSYSLLDTLDLSRNNLEGPFPMPLFRLPNLKILTLSSNNFSGTLQISAIQQLRNLSSLDLSFNSLSIDATANDSTSSSFPQITTLKLASCNLTQFPDFLKNQSKLVYLDLSDNQIDGEIPNWIWGIGSLFHLNLSRNFLVNTRKPSQALTSTLSIIDLHANQLQGQIPVLPPFATYLDYSNNNFSSVIPDTIGDNLTFTYYFSLSSNNFHGCIPVSICNATYLRVLDLSNNSFSGMIPQCLMMSMTLGVLNLKRNKFNGTIANAFPGNCGLQTLDLSGNSLEGKVPKSLANCTMLEVLNLGNNQLNDAFPCHLKNISRLRVLVLRSNNLSGSIDCSDNITTWPMLQIVDLASNNFRGKLPEKCLKTWAAMMDDRNVGHKHLRFDFLQLSGFYYQDAITVTSKGLQMELVKILTVFTSIDLSCNNFEGPIPEEVGKFKALYILNLSHNALTGHIPSVIMNLSQLESLDLSSNNLSGAIPVQLASLTFLSFLNLSHNQLVGKIPTGTQLQSFSAASYEGNAGLCGPPLTENCTNTNEPPSAAPSFEYTSNEFDWRFIVTGLGFGLGAGAVVAPIMVSKKANKWYDEGVEKVLKVIFPMFGLVYTRWDDGKVEPEETFDDSEEEEEDDDDDEVGNENEEFGRRYCVFCSKLDITRKKAIHDPKCICHSPTISSSSSSSSVHFERT